MSRIGEEIAKEASIRASIRTYREFSLDDATIIKKIMERFELSNEVATGYVNEKRSA